jgi:hypothetical protein
MGALIIIGILIWPIVSVMFFWTFIANWSKLLAGFSSFAVGAGPPMAIAYSIGRGEAGGQDPDPIAFFYIATAYALGMTGVAVLVASWVSRTR